MVYCSGLENQQLPVNGCVINTVGNVKCGPNTGFTAQRVTSGQRYGQQGNGSGEVSIDKA